MKDREKFYCGECKESCSGELHDFGSSGEAWGASYSVNLEQYLSSCCGNVMYYRKNNAGEVSGEVPLEQSDY